jgi:hypothetical protein
LNFRTPNKYLADRIAYMILVPRTEAARGAARVGRIRAGEVIRVCPRRRRHVIHNADQGLIVNKKFSSQHTREDGMGTVRRNKAQQKGGNVNSYAKGHCRVTAHSRTRRELRDQLVGLIGQRGDALYVAREFVGGRQILSRAGDGCETESRDPERGELHGCLLFRSLQTKVS